MWIICLADDSHEVPSLICSEKNNEKIEGRLLQFCYLSAAVFANQTDLSL